MLEIVWVLTSVFQLQILIGYKQYQSLVYCPLPMCKDKKKLDLRSVKSIMFKDLLLPRGRGLEKGEIGSLGLADADYYT